MDLTPLATLRRKLLGKTQAINHGTDVSLADQNHHYLVESVYGRSAPQEFD
jgi:hypothetical protein